MNTTMDPDDRSGRDPDASGAAPTGPTGAGVGAGPSGDDVHISSPEAPPPPPIDPQGSGPGWAGGAATPGSAWSGSAGGGYTPAAPPPGPTPNRRPLLVGIAAGAGAVVVLGAILYALWPDRGGDPDDTAQPPVATSTAPATPSPTETTEGPTVSVVDRTVPATQVWTPMGVSCETGDVLRIAMSGSASHDQSASGTVGPTGLLDPFFHQFNVEGFPDANTMTVIGSLDEDTDTYFVVGEGTTYVCPKDGELFLGVNDSGVENNSGAFLATITLTHA